MPTTWDQPSDEDVREPVVESAEGADHPDVDSRTDGPTLPADTAGAYARSRDSLQERINENFRRTSSEMERLERIVHLLQDSEDCRTLIALLDRDFF